MNKHRLMTFKFLAVAMFLGGCAVHQEPLPKYVYIERQKKIAVAIDAPWSQRATKKDVNKLGYSAANSDQVEAFNRTDASCDMKCSDRITTGGGITYDSRKACHGSCMVAEGWSLIEIEEDQK